MTNDLTTRAVVYQSGTADGSTAEIAFVDPIEPVRVFFERADHTPPRWSELYIPFDGVVEEGRQVMLYDPALDRAES
jgi:hypothetical protein